MMKLVLAVVPSRSQGGLASLYIDNPTTINKTKTDSSLVLQIRVAPILRVSSSSQLNQASHGGGPS